MGVFSQGVGAVAGREARRVQANFTVLFAVPESACSAYPHPGPLPLAGEGEGERDMALALPLPLAGEGWGEGPTSPESLDKEISAFSVLSVLSVSKARTGF